MGNISIPPAARRDLYAALATTPLPQPRSVHLLHRGAVGNFGDLDMDDDAPEQVGAWAAAYGATPRYGPIFGTERGRPQRVYEAQVTVAGWDMHVRTLVHLEQADQS